MTESYFWVNNPDYRIFRKEDPNNPTWCVVSKPLVEWGDNLISRLMQDPVAGKVGFAKWKLFDRYARLYHKTTAEHRAETNLDNHPCLHQALLTIWQKLEDVEIQAAIPELEPPGLHIIPSGRNPVINEPEQEEPTDEEVTGIIVGFEEVEPARDADRKSEDTRPPS